MNTDLMRVEYLKLKKSISFQDAYEELSSRAQKLLVYIITVMNVAKSTYTYPIDQFLCEFDLTDYYKLTKTKTGSDNIIRQALEELCQTTYWIPLENGEWQCVSWLKDALISADGHVKVELHKFVGLGLAGLVDPVPNWGMKMQYSNRLYRFLKSYKRIDIVCTVDQVRNELEATASSYRRFSNFKQRILDAAVHELNNCTDICVQFRKINSTGINGKSEILAFTVSPKLKYLKPDSTSRADVKKRLRKKNLPLPEVEIPPAEEVDTVCEAQSVQGAKGQLLLAKQAVDKQPSTPDESETEDLPF